MTEPVERGTDGRIAGESWTDQAGREAAAILARPPASLRPQVGLMGENGAEAFAILHRPEPVKDEPDGT